MEGDCEKCMGNLGGDPCSVCGHCVECCFQSCTNAPSELECRDCEQLNGAADLCRACCRCFQCCPVEGQLCAHCKCHLEVSLGSNDSLCEECGCQSCGRIWSEGGGVGGSGDLCVNCEKEYEEKQNAQEVDDEEPQKKQKL